MNIDSTRSEEPEIFYLSCGCEVDGTPVSHELSMRELRGLYNKINSILERVREEEEDRRAAAFAARHPNRSATVTFCGIQPTKTLLIWVFAMHDELGGYAFMFTGKSLTPRSGTARVAELILKHLAAKSTAAILSSNNDDDESEDSSEFTDFEAAAKEVFESKTLHVVAVPYTSHYSGSAELPSNQTDGASWAVRELFIDGELFWERGKRVPRT